MASGVEFQVCWKEEGGRVAKEGGERIIEEERRPEDEEGGKRGEVREGGKELRDGRKKGR